MNKILKFVATSSLSLVMVVCMVAVNVSAIRREYEALGDLVLSPGMAPADFCGDCKGVGVIHKGLRFIVTEISGPAPKGYIMGKTCYRGRNVWVTLGFQVDPSVPASFNAKFIVDWDELEKELAEKQKEIVRLRCVIARLKNVIADLRRQLAVAGEKIAKLEREKLELQLKNSEAELQETEKQEREVDNRIKWLNNQLDKFK